MPFVNAGMRMLTAEKVEAEYIDFALFLRRSVNAGLFVRGRLPNCLGAMLQNTAFNTALLFQSWPFKRMIGNFVREQSPNFERMLRLFQSSGHLHHISCFVLLFDVVNATFDLIGQNATDDDDDDDDARAIFTILFARKSIGKRTRPNTFTRAHAFDLSTSVTTISFDAFSYNSFWTCCDHVATVEWIG